MKTHRKTAKPHDYNRKVVYTIIKFRRDSGSLEQQHAAELRSARFHIEHRSSQPADARRYPAKAYMKSKYLPFLLVIAGVVAFGFMHHTRSRSQQPIADTSESHYLPVRQSQPKDHNVCCSILKDIALSIEIQPQWDQASQFLLQVNVEKPVGTTYFVNPVEQSFILFVDGHPWAVPEIHKPSAAQDTLHAKLGSHNPLLRFPPSIGDGDELVIEWINYNLRTGQLERLRSQPLTVNIAG